MKRRIVGRLVVVVMGSLWILGSMTRAMGDELALSQAQAKAILADTGVRGGLVVHVGCGDGRLTSALRANESCLVHGLDRDEADVAAARALIGKLGLYGPVSVEHWEGKELPYADNLVNLLVVSEPAGLANDELMRVLAPRGVAYVRGKAKWSKRIKPWPARMDEWSHYFHDATGNAVADDDFVGPPTAIQWVAKPLYSRSHEIDSSVSALVSAGGRVFYILDEGLTGITDERLPACWSLLARDAFSGVLLWKRPIAHWGWREWKRDQIQGADWTQLRGQRGRFPAELPRRLVAEGNRVYVTLGFDAPLSILDAATGKTIHECPGTQGAHELVCGGQTLIVRLVSGLAERQLRRQGKRPPETIVAIDPGTGTERWRRNTDPLRPFSLAIDRDKVIFHTGRELVCLDLGSGADCWRAKTPAGQTLVTQDGVILIIDPKTLRAISLETGQVLWTGPGARGPGAGTDLFVTDGLVWRAEPIPGPGYEKLLARYQSHAETGVRAVGRDLRTGQIKQTVEIENLVSAGHHFRCYRSKATSRYILWPKRGVEFVDLKADNHMRHDWLRASCKYGMMPCNGLLYAPPHQCFCYPGAALNGFLALSSPPEPHADRVAPTATERLQRGPAFSSARKQRAMAIDPARDWPTFRHDAKRSGSIACKVPANAKQHWQVSIGGRLTQPVVVGDRLFVAAIDQHTVHALNAGNGKRLWSRTVDGRVDSPPTIYQGLVLFGSANGHVYCLDADSGDVCWQFRAAPREQRVVAFGQLESSWPVHGSVLVKDKVAYVAAGRSSFLQEGIHLYGLGPESGKVLYHTCIQGPHPDLSKDIGRDFAMDGTRSDVLVTDGTFLYMQQTMLDANLVEQETPRLSHYGDRKMGRHLLATAGLLDDTWFNRTYWMYANRWPGFYFANQAPKAGQLLVFDESTTYAVKCFTKRNIHSPLFFPATTGYLLFADNNDNEPILAGEPGAPKPIKWLPDVTMPAYDYKGRHITDQHDDYTYEIDKGTGFTRARPPLWAQWLPIRIRAMVATRDTLFVAGPPDVLDPKDPLAAFQNRKGGLLRAYSTDNGKQLSEQPIESPPAFDGLIAANERLYLATADGRVRCLGAGR